MDQNIKKDWLKDLRSGTFEQSAFTLHDLEGGYCCLGVLCESALGGDCWILDEGSHHRLKPGDDYETAYTNLPNALAERFGLDDATLERLMSMNDDEDMSFDEIADWIEENL